ncbi:MAG: hypothetical protein IIA00_07215 [Proteobacteria bacterium]|nr:hypothetical protein [Pseudomonadota bacterium]
MPDGLGPLIAGISTVGAVGGFGYFIDGKLSDEFRDRVRDKLNRVSGADDTWPALFLIMFDRLFVPGQRRRPSFKRSAAVSINILAFLLILWVVFLPQRLDFLLDEMRRELGTEYDVGTALPAFFFLGVMINLIADYFSLWESRFVLGRMTTKGGAVNNAVYLLVDFVATVVIFALAVSLAFFVIDVFSKADELVFRIFAKTAAVFKMFINGGLLFSHDVVFTDLIAAYLYTTLFTSVWVWIFMLGGVFWPLFSWLSKVLAVDKYPVGSVMAIGGVFLGLIITAAGYVRMAIVP